MTTERAPATPVSQDEVLAQLRTRGFEEGFQRTTLRDFWGKLTKISGEMRPGARGPFMVVLYDFDGVEVIESTEPYESPIGQIEIPHSNTGRSKMGYWGKSIDKMINPAIDFSISHGQPGVRNQDSLLGKMLHTKLTPGHMIPHRDDATNQWADEPVDCWEILEIRGEGTAPAPAATQTPPKPGEPPLPPAPTPTGESVVQAALKELDGKNQAQWHQAVFSNPTVKADIAFVQTIISGEFIAGQEAAGIVTKDGDGIYHVKQ